MKPIRHLLQLLAPFKLWIGAIAVLSFGTTASAIALVATSSYLISKAATVSEVASLSIAFAGVRLFAISRACFRYLERLTSHRLAFRVLARLRAWYYEAVEPIAPARLSRHRTGDLLSRSLADVETLEGFYIRVLVPAAASVMATVFVCLVLGAFDPAIAATALLFLVVAGVGLPLLGHRLGARPSRRLIAARSELNAALVDEIQGVEDLLVFDQGHRHQEATRALAREMTGQQGTLAGLRGGSSALHACLVTAAAVAVFWLAIPLVSGGTIDGVYLALLALVTVAGFEAVQSLPSAFQQLETSVTAGGRIFELIDSQPAVAEPRIAAPLPLEPNLELRDVSFRYQPSGDLVLDRFSLSLPLRRCIALTGESGAGKSTLVNLLLRFWEYEAGEVTLGGRDVRQYRTEDVRGLIAVMPQEVHLFNTTVKENLLIANLDATNEQLETACRMTLVDDFVRRLPEGYDTVVGENGLLLSGGERQRLALARMVLTGAPIVVMDEPTANLDVVTEERLMRTLQPFLASRTVLLLSHRPAVTAVADEVYELVSGRAFRVSPAAA